MAMRRLGTYSALVWLLGSSLAFAGAPTRTYTYVSGQVIDPGQVTTNEDNIYGYLQGGVDTYSDGSIVAADLADSAVTTAKILDSTIATGDIADGTIVNADISTSAAIAYSKLNLSGSITGGDIVNDTVVLGTDTSGNYAGSASEGGAASTATALAANGANCSAGNYPLGVDASGAVETCTAVSSAKAIMEFSTTSMSADRYFPFAGTDLGDGTEANVNITQIPFGATIKNLYCNISTAPGAGTSWVITVRDDAANTALTCTISESSVACSDTSNTPTVAAASNMTIFWDANGAVAGSSLSACTMEVDPT